MAFITPLLTKLIIAEGHHVEIRGTEFYPIQSRNMEITGRNVFTPPK
jgi:hypothetical protein